MNADTARMFRVRKTCLKMLQKRGYVIPETHLRMTPQEFTDVFGDSPSRESLTVSAEKDDESIFVFFPDDEKVGVKPLKVYCQRMREANVLRAIIVVKGAMTPFARSAVKEMMIRGYRMEYFKDAELLVDITEHKLVPEHSILTAREKDELLQRYRLKPSQLPRIMMMDPIARYYGLKKDQVVKIVRPSETAGRYITYRICV